MLRLPGALSPLSSTSEVAKASPYSASTRSMISCATAAVAGSRGVSSVMGISSLVMRPSLRSAVGSMMMQPTFMNVVAFALVPVDWMGSPFGPSVITVWL